MIRYISKDAVAAEIEKLESRFQNGSDEDYADGYHYSLKLLKRSLDTLEEKDMDLIINTIIEECCDWLAICTGLSLGLIEDCRNLMLAVKEEQFKAQKKE